MCKLDEDKLVPLDSRTLKVMIDDSFYTTAYLAGRNSATVTATKLISEEAAGTLLKTAAVRLLDNVELVLKCPIITDHGVVSCGVHNEALVVYGLVDKVETRHEAVEIINNILVDFNFVTPADKARAISMFITPALKFGGLLKCRCPIFMVEADSSQAGKGLMTELSAIIYNAKIESVTVRDGGVGGLDESIDMAMVSGAPFIRIDNVRGRQQSQHLESLLTEPGETQARIPHIGFVPVCPSRHVWQLTANGVEATHDLMNRSSIISIKKRPDDYQFKDWDGLGIVGWTEQNRPRILGAIFRIVQEWIDAGKPSLTCPSHDFREWAGVMSWFCQTVFNLPAPSEGHRQAAAQRADPVKAWLHTFGSKLLVDNEYPDSWLPAQRLIDASNRHELEIPSTDAGTLGRLLSKCFENGLCKLDGMVWQRSEAQISRTSGQPFLQKQYRVLPQK